MVKMRRSADYAQIQKLDRRLEELEIYHGLRLGLRKFIGKSRSRLRDVEQDSDPRPINTTTMILNSICMFKNDYLIIM